MSVHRNQRVNVKSISQRQMSMSNLLVNVSIYEKILWLCQCRYTCVNVIIYESMLIYICVNVGIYVSVSVYFSQCRYIWVNRNKTWIVSLISDMTLLSIFDIPSLIMQTDNRISQLQLENESHAFLIFNLFRHLLNDVVFFYPWSKAFKNGSRLLLHWGNKSQKTKKINK